MQTIYDQAWAILRDEHEAPEHYEAGVFSAPAPVWTQLKAISSRLVAHELSLAGKRDQAQALLAKANEVLVR